MIRKLKHKILNRNGILDKPHPDYVGEEANHVISQTLHGDNPCMIARFGAFELGMALSAMTPVSLRNIWRLMKGDIAYIGWNKSLADSLCHNAGFFPNTKRHIRQFAELLKEDMKQCDILGSWLPGEKQVANIIGNGNYKSVALYDLEPFHHKHPYTLELEGKKVLLIHPYKNSITKQWEYRDKLFNGKIIMPDCNLTILQAIQTIAGNNSGYESWFDALDHMKAMMDKIEYDVALIGCGAYGFHLAAHAKRTGHKAVHLGGVLQILFGVMGKRWEGKYSFVNDYWIHPLPSDTIQNAQSIENGCYW